MEYLNSLQTKYSAHSDKVAEIINFFNNKYWHQFGEHIRAFANLPEIGQTDEVKSLFDMIFENIQINIDPLIFVELSAKAALRIESLEQQDVFMDQIDERIREKHAKIMILSVRAMIHVLASNFEKAKGYLLEAEPKLKAMYNLDKIVYSTFFKSRALYYLKKSEYSEFYQNSLQFLAYTDPVDLSEDEKLDISTNMAVAILVSEKIFNFSELLELEVFQSLRNTENAFLVTLMETYNKGDVVKFYEDIKKFESQLKENATLSTHSNILEDKIKIAAFTELVFTLPKNNRQVSFQTISEVTTIPIEMIELMIIKAMSLDLIRGSIDEVSQTVDITWIQPRVLDKARILQMREKFADWQQSINGLLGFVTEYRNSL